MTRVGAFVLDSFLGQGGFAIVHRARHSTFPISVAVKTIPKIHFADPLLRTHLMREFAVLKQIDHPFIGLLFEVCEDSDHYYLIQELADGGSLLEAVQKRGRIPEALARRYFSQLILAIHYLHLEKMIVHRDIKCENILLDRNNNIRLIDFGLSRIFTDFSEEFATECGSPAYVSPERVCRKSYTRAADIWSLGVVLYTMVTGGLPFWDADPGKLMDAIAKGTVEYPLYLSELLIDLLKKVLCVNPDERANLVQIKEHPWMGGPGGYCAQLREGIGRLGGMVADIEGEAKERMREIGIDPEDVGRAGGESDIRTVYRICCRERAGEKLRAVEEAAERRAAREKAGNWRKSMGQPPPYSPGRRMSTGGVKIEKEVKLIAPRLAPAPRRRMSRETFGESSSPCA
jgi:hypothetical protein